jgi:hypothetical protein
MPGSPNQLIDFVSYKRTLQSSKPHQIEIVEREHLSCTAPNFDATNDTVTAFNNRSEQLAQNIFELKATVIVVASVSRRLCSTSSGGCRPHRQPSLRGSAGDPGLPSDRQGRVHVLVP